jgi:hypothetical protein
MDRIPANLIAMNSSERPGVAAATLATSLVGSAVAASTLIVGYPVLSGQALRYGLGAAALVLIQRWRGRRLPRLSPREAGLVMALTATGLVGFNLCLLGAIGRADPAVVGVVVGCVPVLLGLAAPAGLALAGGALLGEAAFSLLAVPLLPRLGPLALSAYTTGAASAVLAVGAVGLEGRHALRLPTAPEAGALAWLAVGHAAGVRDLVLERRPPGGGARGAVRRRDPGGVAALRRPRRQHHRHAAQAGRVGAGRRRHRGRPARRGPGERRYSVAVRRTTRSASSAIAAILNAAMPIRTVEPVTRKWCTTRSKTSLTKVPANRVSATGISTRKGLKYITMRRTCSM